MALSAPSAVSAEPQEFSIDDLAEVARHSERLSVVVFGPDYGESIVVRCPPDEWLVVDSLVADVGGIGINPAAALLDARAAKASCVVLTHPHKDHAMGLADLLDRRSGGKVGCLEVNVEPPEEWLTSPDLMKVLDTGAAEHALAAIADTWRREPDSCWPLVAPHDTLHVGEVSVESLHPTENFMAVARRVPPRDFNDLSSPLILGWRDLRVILAADLPGRHWPGLTPADGIAVGRHSGLKVSHHGSRKAQFAGLGDPQGLSRRWVMTPMYRGHRLPRFEDGEGVDVCLGAVEELDITAVPQAPGVGTLTGGTRTATRREVQDAIERSKFGDLVLEYEGIPPSVLDSWVAMEFSASGALVEVLRGRAAVTVRR